MKARIFVPLLLISITSCSQSASPLVDKIFCFDSMIETKLYEGDKDNLNNLKDIFNKLDKLTDNYQARGVNNVFIINNTHEDVVIDKDLYDLLKLSFEFNNTVSNYFNPLCGSLSKKWKESLKNQQILPENIRNEELLKISTSSLLFKDNYTVQRIGEAEIDLGGIAKGYALDKAYEYLSGKEMKHYLIDGGRSSILLGEKKSKDGLFTVGVNDVSGAFLKLKNCFVSTSGLSVQGVEIDGVKYSHIINPLDGSAINKHDAVIVISDKGYFGDALSTSLMLNTIEEIKEMEKVYNVKTIVVDNKKVSYCHDDIEVFYR